MITMSAVTPRDFDIPAIGRFVLGRFSRGVAPADQQSFDTLFEDVIVYTWSRRFSEYNGQTLKVMGSTPDGDQGSLVKSTVIGKGGTPSPTSASLTALARRSDRARL